MKRMIGIIGGMGPLATCDLYRKIILMTEAKQDQEHLHVLIDGNTNIPDRTAAILSFGADPLPELKKSAARLIGMGASVLAMPCNTAHYFYQAVREYALTLNEEVCFVNMLEETAALAKARGIRTVGLLATDGTIRAGVYERDFAAQGVQVAIPSEARQKAVMSLIYDGVKAGRLAAFDTRGFEEAIEELLTEKKAEALVLGCTELPIAFDELKFNRPTIDPTAVLAAAVIRAAGGTVVPAAAL